MELITESQLQEVEKLMCTEPLPWTHDTENSRIVDSKGLQVMDAWGHDGTLKLAQTLVPLVNSIPAMADTLRESMRLLKLAYLREPSILDLEEMIDDFLVAFDKDSFDKAE